jgi:uridine kinase
MFRYLCLFLLLFTQSLFSSDKLVIGIAGGTGSGKTTLAQKIKEAFPDRAILLSQDAYYKEFCMLSMEEKASINFDHPSSLDFDLFKEHIVDLKNDQMIEQPVYDFCTHSRMTKTKRIEPADIIVVEGILLFAVPEIRDLIDIKVFIETDDDVRLLRRIERDIKERARDLEGIRDQYLKTVKPMHEEFVKPSRQYADVIVPLGGENTMALSVILSKLRESL